MAYLPEKGWQRIAVIAFYAVLGIGAFRFAGQVLVRFLLPFLIAWAVAALLHPLTVRLGRHTAMPPRILRVLTMAASLGLIGVLTYAVCSRLLYESGRLLEILGRDAPSYIDGFFGFFADLGERIPLIGALTQSETREGIVISAAESAIGAASAHLPAWIAAMISRLPDLLLFAVMTVIAAFYIASDFDRINAFLCAQMPSRTVAWLRRFRRRMIVTGFRYLRAYAALTVITFGELYLGFRILRIEYAFTIALFTAVIDVLPVLGIGTVLIPWGLALLLTGDIFTGVGLLALFGIVTLLRHVIEPKILGASLGLYPLATLIALYAGYRFGGIGGMIVFPVLLIVLRDLNESGTLRLWRDPAKSGEKTLR